MSSSAKAAASRSAGTAERDSLGGRARPRRVSQSRGKRVVRADGRGRHAAPGPETVQPHRWRNGRRSISCRIRLSDRPRSTNLEGALPPHADRALHALDARGRSPVRSMDPLAPPARRGAPRPRSSVDGHPRRSHRMGGMDRDVVPRGRRLHRPGSPRAREVRRRRRPLCRAERLDATPLP